MSQVTLVMLPGIDGTDVFFRPLVARLSPLQPVRIVEFPPGGPHTYDDLLELVVEATSDLSRMVVLGFSFSGPLAVRFARREPERVTALILVATFLTPPRPALRRYGRLLRGPAVWLFRLARRLPGWLLSPRDDPRRAAKLETWRRVPASAVAARLRQVARVDASDDLRVCIQPVLSIGFSRDEAVGRSSAEEIRHACPSARVLSLEGTHLTMFDDPGLLLAALHTFATEATTRP